MGETKLFKFFGITYMLYSTVQPYSNQKKDFCESFSVNDDPLYF
jgi:hypothetical protein